MNTYDEFRKVGQIHGHLCPGLAIGVRAALTAQERLGSAELRVVAERSACWLDGMLLIGATLGNGKLKLRDSGKAAFSFFDETSGKSMRLVLKAGPAGLSREEMIDRLLTAAAEDVFTFGSPSYTFPEYKASAPEVICSVCGEAVCESHAFKENSTYICKDCKENT